MLYIKESVLNEEDTHNDYPAAAKKNAQKAIDWKEKYGRDEVDAGTPVGWARAHQLAKGENLSTDTVKRMSAFNRHRKNSSIKPELKETPWKDRGYVAWLIWGGDEGVDWAIEKSKEIDAMKESKQLKYIKPLNEAEKYITDEFKVGDKIKTNFGEWEVIETDYAPNKSFIAPFIFKGKDMERVNIPNPPKTNKKAVGYKVTDGDKYPIIGFLYQYKDITKLATVGVDESVDEARSSKEKFEEEEAEFKRIIASPDKRVYDLVDYAQFTTGGMTQKQWEMFMYGRYKKHLQSRDAKIKEKMYDVLTKWLTESVNEEKIKYVKGKTYQSSGHWTVVVDSNSSGLDIRVNHSAGWRLDPHDEKEETFELLDNGRQRATLYFKSGNIDKFAKQMFDLNDRTTHGNATKLTAKDYGDILRVWIDMRMANEAKLSTVHRAAKKGSYPAVIVVVQDGKVIHQEPVSTPDVAPATFNVMQERYPKAVLHLEDNTGKRLFSESVTEGIYAKESKIVPGEYIKTQYGYFYKRVEGKVGGQDAYVEIKKGKEGKRKTSIHDTVDFDIVDKSVALGESVKTHKHIKHLNEGYWSHYDYEKWTKENGKPKYPKWVKVTLKEIVKGGFMDPVYDAEHNYMVLWLASLETKRRSEMYAYDKKGIKEFGKVGYAMYQRFYNDLTGYNMFFMQGAMYALEVSKHIQDRIANGEAVEPAYYMMKEYFNGFGMKTDRSRVFNAAYEKLEKWMKDNQIKTL